MSKKLRELQAKKAQAAQAKSESLKAASGLLDKAAAESRDLTAEEQAEFGKHKAAADAKAGDIDRIQTQIDIEQEMIAAQAQAQGVVHIAGNGTDIRVEENVEKDPKRGWTSKGDFFKAVRSASNAAATGAQIDPRLRIGAAAPTTYSNEGNGADGGFAIPPAFSQEIWRLSLDDGSLVPMTLNTEVSGNSMVFPKDETTPWGGNGVQAYWKGEASAANQSKLLLGTEMMRLKELMVLVPVTNELLDDAPALGTYITPLAGERIQWKTNEAILFGPGGQQPQGCMSSNALVVVAKESGQATQTISQPNISKMRSRLLTGQLKNAIWIGNPDILPALEGLTVGQIPIFLPPGTGIREGGYDGTLNGRPLILSEHASAFSSQGDLSLISLKGYRTITKAGGIETATSMHLYFDANATAFRFIFRIDGQPVMQAPVTPPAGKSTNTRSYFVTLGAR
jgi:HK97 family phage major capsid protein